MRSLKQSEAIYGTMLVTWIFLLTAIGGAKCRTLWSWSHETSQKDIHDVLKNGFDYSDTHGQFGIGASDSLTLAEDPHTDGQYVLRVFYKAGTYSGHDSSGHECHSNCHRGAQFYIQPNSLSGHHYTSLTLEYEVLFESGFGWNKGGKLPGLWGGDRICSGGRKSETCFSTRLMWRPHGDGEVYGYITHHQDPDSWSTFCNKYKTWSLYHRINCTHDNYGIEIGTGSFRFRTNHWTKVKQTVKLNSHSGEHGTIALWVDDKAEIYITNAVIRNQFDFAIDGIFFSTFYGGGDDSWECPSDTHTFFKNFKLSTGGSTPSTSELVG